MGVQFVNDLCSEKPCEVSVTHGSGVEVGQVTTEQRWAGKSDWSDPSRRKGRFAWGRR